MEWRDENDEMEDDGRMMKNGRKWGNRVIRKLVIMRDCLKKREKNLKYKKRNRVYTIHGGDYKRKLYLNPHTNPVFYASPRSGDVILIMISILHLILPPRQT